MADSADAGAQKRDRLRALTFGGGGFNSAMQLGVTHALLVARGVAPDYVAGLSAGAVTAAALAEILQSGEGKREGERRNAQVDNFRKFLASFQELPGELLQSILPDAYEINASLPLEPIELPIHFDAERRGRDDANQTRAGLIRILNRLLEIRLPVSAIAVIVNRILRFVAASEEPSRWRRIWRRFNNAGRLWCLGYWFILGLAPTFRSLAWAAIAGAPREWLDRASFYSSLASGRSDDSMPFPLDVSAAPDEPAAALGAAGAGPDSRALLDRRRAR